MNHAAISYRGFHDFPRMVLVRAGDRLLLLDCEFDQQRDDYRDQFVVWLMPNDFQEPSGSWESLQHHAVRRLGEIGASKQLFDSTLRKTIDLDALSRLLP